MSCRTHPVRRAAWVLLVALLVPQVSIAQDKQVVRAGEPAVVARTERPTSGEKAASGGVAKIVRGATTVLLYLPPDGVNEIEDSVQYTTTDNQVVTVPISVRSRSPTLTDPQFYNASFKAVFGLFILAVLVESGLALIFRWPPFLDFFDSRSVNAVVAFVFSLLFVSIFNLDIATTLVNVYSGTSYPWNWPGMILTALIIAGGSAGVNRLLQSLGFRPIGGPQQPPPVLQANQAWLSVTLIRDQAVGPVYVEIGVPNGLAVAGTVRGSTRDRGLLRYFLRDKGRFPQSGGFTVVPGQYQVQVTGSNAIGNKVGPAIWGPHDIAPRALVDIELKL